jgi:nitrogen fixation NifU-like protein
MAPASDLPELEDVYQSLILDHSRRPRNFGAPPGATQSARGDNPFCGDRVTVFLVRSGDRIADVGFEGVGCAISMASASMMTTHLKGLTPAETETLCRRFEDLLDGAAHENDELGDLSAFAAVSRFPVRVKCARLPWQTLLAALTGAAKTVSTE